MMVRSIGSGEDEELGESYGLIETADLHIESNNLVTIVLLQQKNLFF